MTQKIPHNKEVKHRLDPQKQTEKEGRKGIYQGKYKKNQEFPGAIETHGFPYRINQGVPVLKNHTTPTGAFTTTGNSGIFLINFRLDNGSCQITY
jgi:hypothetical protein